MNSSLCVYTTRHAFEMGEQANYDGAMRSANPYAAGDMRPVWWEQGWNSAQAARAGGDVRIKPVKKTLQSPRAA